MDDIPNDYVIPRLRGFLTEGMREMEVDARSSDLVLTSSGVRKMADGKARLMIGERLPIRTYKNVVAPTSIPVSKARNRIARIDPDMDCPLDGFFVGPVAGMTKAQCSGLSGDVRVLRNAVIDAPLLKDNASDEELRVLMWAMAFHESISNEKPSTLYAFDYEHRDLNAVGGTLKNLARASAVRFIGVDRQDKIMREVARLMLKKLGSHIDESQLTDASIVDPLHIVSTLIPNYTDVTRVHRVTLSDLKDAGVDLYGHDVDPIRRCFALRMRLIIDEMMCFSNALVGGVQFEWEAPSDSVAL